MNKILKIEIRIRDCLDLRDKTFNNHSCGSVYPLKVTTNVGYFEDTLPREVVSYIYETAGLSYFTIPRVVSLLDMLNENGIKFYLTGNVSKKCWENLEKYKFIFNFDQNHSHSYDIKEQCTPAVFVSRLAQLKQLYPNTQIQTLVASNE